MRRKTDSTVTIPLEEYNKMRDDIKDLTDALDSQVTVIEKLLKKNETLCRSINEIKDKYFADGLCREDLLALWAQMEK